MGDSTTALAPLASWAAGLRYEDIPEESRRAARYQIANMIAAAWAAQPLDDARAIQRGLLKLSGGGRARLIGEGGGNDATTDPVTAAMINAARSMAEDFDDIIWMGHTCHSAVFAPLAVAQHEGRSTRELVTAVVVANELAGRLGASSFLGPLNGQMWTFIHLIGAAAGAGRLLGLNETRMLHALAIALAQPNFALQPGFMNPTSKLLSASVPLGTGIQAAYLAREGVTGSPVILEDRRGFWRRFSFRPLPYMLGELGRFWAIQTLELKTYPGCHYFQTAASALKELLEKHGPFRLDDVSRLVLDTTKLGYEVTSFARDYSDPAGPITPVNVNFDLATTIAVYLHAGRLTCAEFAPEWLAANTDGIRAWLGKIRVRHDPGLTALVLGSARALPTGRQALRGLTASELVKLASRYRQDYGSSLFSGSDLSQWLRLAGRAARRRFAAKRDAEARSTSAIPLHFPNRVTVTFDDEREASAQVDLPVGAFCAPGCENELRAKFTGAGQAIFGRERAEAAFGDLLRLESHTLDLFEKL